MNITLLPLSFFSRFTENFVFFFFGSILFNLIILFVIPGIIELFNKIKNKESKKNKPKSKVNKVLVAILVIICFCLFSSVDSLYKLYNLYVDLETTHSECENKYSKLKESLKTAEDFKSYWVDQYMDEANSNNSYKKQVDEINTKYEELLTKYSELESKYNEVNNSSQSYNGYSYLISINPDFNLFYYHLPSCLYITSSDSFALVSVEVAEKENYKPCPLCIKD